MPRLLLGVAIFCLASCAGSNDLERKRYFWPAFSEQPKIEYINYYHSSADLERGKSNFLEDYVLGKQEPQRLFSIPHDVASNGQGTVFVTDTAQRRVLVLDLPNYALRYLVQVENGTPYVFRFPSGIAVDDHGRTWVVDSLKRDVNLFSPSGVFVRSVGGKKTLVRPQGVGVSPVDGRVYVADVGAHAIVVFSSEGQFLQRFGEFGAKKGQFNSPVDVDVDADGRVYVVDALNARVQMFSADGEFIRTMGQRGYLADEMLLPKGIAVSADGIVYITDGRGNKMLIFDKDGNYLLTIGGMSSAVKRGGFAPGGVLMPTGVDIDAGGGIWLVDKLNGVLHKYQYLTDEYLNNHPIAPEQIYQPPRLNLGE